MKRLGFLLNPLAGLGGRVGLKGSDGAETVAQALARGAAPMASRRAAIALAALGESEASLFTAAGAMGADVCREAGLRQQAAYWPRSDATSAGDTIDAARALLAMEVDLILFAGGDGTARDIAGVVGAKVPLVGVPAGVKMYSGVFAASPAHAGQIVRRFLSDPQPRVREAEILDVDEDSCRHGKPATTLFGYARTPSDPAVQRAKSSPASHDDAELDALCQAEAASLEPGRLHIIGPGSTMQRLMSAAGLTGALLGVDLVLDGALLARDVDEATILAHLEKAPGIIHVGVIGGAGCLFGRGNLPISPAVIARVGRANIRVLASLAKLASLAGGLFVDTGAAEIDRMLSGYLRVQTGVRREMMVRVTD